MATRVSSQPVKQGVLNWAKLSVPRAQWSWLQISLQKEPRVWISQAFKRGFITRQGNESTQRSPGNFNQHQGSLDTWPSRAEGRAQGTQINK